MTTQGKNRQVQTLVGSAIQGWFAVTELTANDPPAVCCAHLQFSPSSISLNFVARSVTNHLNILQDDGNLHAVVSSVHGRNVQAPEIVSCSKLVTRMWHRLKNLRDATTILRTDWHQISAFMQLTAGPSSVSSVISICCT